MLVTLFCLYFGEKPAEKMDRPIPITHYRGGGGGILIHSLTRVPPPPPRLEQDRGIYDIVKPLTLPDLGTWLGNYF